ncbi:MAG: hypothetical protein HXY36_04000 [Chloroflexi bacterium]|nr:hypothetical protein [Chloroflexota bacterium]
MLKRPKYCVVRFSILLIALVLIAGTVACSSGLPGFTPRYGLRISSTIGGTVTSPGEGLFYYAKGTVVNIVAQPDLGYQFARWIGNVNTIANPVAATTTLTINYHSFLIAQFKEI